MLATAWASWPADAALDQARPRQPDLAAADQPVAGPHHRRVGPDRRGPAVVPSSVIDVPPSSGRPPGRQALGDPRGCGHGGEHRVGTAHRSRRRSRRSHRCTVIGGVSRARRTPNERMVRSWGTPSSDRDGLGADPPERHVGRAGGRRSAAPSRRAGRRTHRHLTPTRAPVAVDVTARPRPAPVRARSTAARRPTPPAGGTRPRRRPGRGQQHGRLGPAGRPESADIGGPATLDLDDLEARRPGRDRRRDAQGRRTTRMQPGAVGAHAGRHRRPLRAQPHHVLPGKDHPHRPAVLVGQPPGGRRSRRGDLSAEGPAVAGGLSRLAAGQTPRCVRLQVGRLDPGGPQGDVPLARGTSSGWRSACPLRRPGTLPARGPGLGQRLAAPPIRRARRVRPPGHPRPARLSVGEPAPAAATDVGTDPCLGGAPLEAARRAASRDRAVGRRAGHPGAAGACRRRRRHDRSPAGAAAQVGQQGRLRPLDRGRAGPSGGQPAHDPRRAKPALAGAVADERLGQAGRTSGPARRRWSPTAGHPPHRGHARHPGDAIHQHGAAPALALRAAAVLDDRDPQLLAEGVEQTTSSLGSPRPDRPSRAKAMPRGQLS